MQKIQVAFYKGRGGWTHKIIRWWTKSPYSHAELIMPDDKTWISISPFLTSRVAPRIKRRDKWYCSEWIAHAMVNSRILMWDDLRLYDTPDLSPGKLYDVLRANCIHRAPHA